MTLVEVTFSSQFPELTRCHALDVIKPRMNVNEVIDFGESWFYCVKQNERMDTAWTESFNILVNSK